MTDWIMIIITLVYVVATIFICKANFKSANASKEQLKESKKQHEEAMKSAKEQLEESKRQFEETIRMQCTPFLQLEPTKTENYQLVQEFSLTNEETEDCIVGFCYIKNLGNGAATNLVYQLICKELGINTIEPFKICGIRAGDSYLFKFEFEISHNFSDDTKAYIIFDYDDVLGNKYEQKVVLNFAEYEYPFSFETDLPRFIGEVKYMIADKEKKL